MADNPYAPPHAELGYEAPPLDGTFDVSRCIEDGWHLTWASFPTWLGVGCVMGLLSGLSALLFLLPALLVVPPLAWGMTFFYLNVVDRRESFGDLFAGFSFYGTALIAMLGWYVCTFLISFIGSTVDMLGSAVGSGLLIALGSLFSLAWALFVTARLYFAPFFIVDHGMGPVAALRASWEITSEQRLRTAGLTLLTAAIMLAGVIALLIGLIPALNISALMWASAYRQMVPDPTASSADARD